MDDLAARALERSRAGENIERRLGTEPREARCQAERAGWGCLMGGLREQLERVRRAAIISLCLPKRPVRGRIPPGARRDAVAQDGEARLPRTGVATGNGEGWKDVASPSAAIAPRRSPVRVRQAPYRKDLHMQVF